MDIAHMNRVVIEQFRAGGPVDGMDRDALLLLTTVGFKSGQPRTTPLMFHRDDARLLTIGGNFGAPRDPHWYLNIVAEPKVTVEVGDDFWAAIATPLQGPERARVWAMLEETYPALAEQWRKVERSIPIVALTKI
ncbi:nitroreductase/quinone reductase family protein [Nocardia gipuzkoensis]|uniref:nitroreductase/quinone reductase family protein n=1 Tax=Nocardia gipuzkoensis TaxID=2749991 RepID=UPI0015EEEFFA|nr:nitroreductase/quinone reductase family protein [Nocardia gipuzkoensis]